MSEKLNNYPILDLLPQRPPFVMVHQLVHFDPVVTRTLLFVKTDNLFVEGGRLSASGLLENVAQTCAARMGYISRQEQGPIKVGVIGALRNMVVHRLPEVGETLLTSIEVQEEMFGMVLAHASVHSFTAGEEALTDQGVCCLDGEIKIALTNVSPKASSETEQALAMPGQGNDCCEAENQTV